MIHEAHGGSAVGGLGIAFSVASAPDKVEWRTIDFCSAIMRIYGIYEQFAREMLREHLRVLEKNVLFDNLPIEARLALREGVSKILIKIDGPRYANRDEKKLVEEYSRALIGANPYALDADAMLMSNENLRITELARLFKNCGMPDVSAWLGRHPCIVEFFAADTRTASSVEHEMSALIEQRNEVAHGTISMDSILGIDYLNEFCDFISSVCIALCERVQLAGLACLTGNARAVELGEVTELLKKGKVVIAPIIGSISVGAMVYLIGETYCIAREVLGIQVDDVSMDEFTTDAEREIGLLLDAPGKRRARLIVLAMPVAAKVLAVDEAAQ